ncbi:hypothetical protein DLJ58_07285 [Micromonospora arida]|uniref:Uncharacterized protein n=1 Tax=Micromonospora arida TaxID=2203715 RepID=A0A3N9XWH1_9ACTN|nr:hypothetical protein DLJ58_07285 [Micromonospora arida]
MRDPSDEQIYAGKPRRPLANAADSLLPGRSPGRARNPAGLADTTRQHLGHARRVRRYSQSWLDKKKPSSCLTAC